jgi:glycosyltransferase involved in cell wall biosynthesis
MRVLMFGWEFPPHISGGLGNACHGLVKGLVANDVDVTFVVPKAYGDEPDKGLELVSADDIKIHSGKPVTGKIRKRQECIEPDRSSAYLTPQQYARMLREQEERLSQGQINLSPGKYKFSGHYGNRLFDEVSWYGITGSYIAGMIPHDVIHSHDWLTYPAGISAKQISGKPLIVHVHATEFDRCGEIHNKQVFEIEKWGMSAADKVITVSNFTRRIVIDRYKINPEKVITVHNATEPASTMNCRPIVKNIGNDKIVTFLGRITWQKGPEYFITAAHQVLQCMNNTRFVMAGTGDLLGKMIRYAAKLKITDKLHFTGFLKGDDVNRLFAMSDLYVMPSVSEPFGISPLEAIQNNVPVIISKQSGVSEVITHAIKVDFWDTDAFADAIYSVLNYPSLAGHLKNHSRPEAENLTWQGAASSVKNIYLQAIRQAG